MARKLNPFHRRVGDASSRQSEYLIEVSENGAPVTIRGEVTNFEVAPQYQDFSFNISGGGSYEDSMISHYIITITYAFGTDGGYWEQMAIDKENGINRDCALTATTEDIRSIQYNGGRAVRYNNCHIITHNDYENSDSSASSPRLGTVTLYAPRDAKVVLRQFRPTQGV